MANKDLFKQAIAEAKSVREAAIANAKEALEESLTPHLKDMLAAKLQEMEDKDVDEVAVTESEDDVEEAKKDSKDETVEEEFTAVEEAEDDAEEEELADDGEGEEAPEEPAEDAIEDEPAEDEDLKDLSVGDFKDMIRDIIASEMGGGEAEIGAELPADDMDAGAIEEPGEGDPMAGEEGDEEIDLDELIRELESVSEGESEDDMEEGKHDKDEDKVEEVKDGPTKNEVDAVSDSKESNINDTIKEGELNEALETIETLRNELNEVNLLNSKLLYVNKIFKANNLSESQKVNIIAAFDKAETVKEVKLVFETVSDNVVLKKETTIKEHKGSASKATGITASKPEVISEVSSAVQRMQKLAGIIK